MAVVRSFAVVALLVAPALAACSGADDQDVLAPTAGTDTSSTEPAPAAGSKPSAPGASGAPGTSGDNQGEDGDGPSPGADPGAPTGKGQTPPPDQPGAAACTPEIEPNNDLAHATPFTSSVCGTIGSASDIDVVSFVVPKDAGVVRVQHAEMNGRATYHYFLDGALVALDNGELEVVPGATYKIQVRLDKSNGGSASLPSYEIDVAFH